MTRSMSVMKILPSPDFAGLGGLDDRLDHLVHQVAAHRHLDAGLGHEVDDVLGAAVQLGVPALPSETLHLRHRHARDADVRERGAHVVELEGLDDGGDQFHERILRHCGPGTLRREGFCSFHATRRMQRITRAGCCGRRRIAPPRRRTSLGHPPALRRSALVRQRRARPWAILRAMYQQIVIVGGRTGGGADRGYPTPHGLRRQAHAGRGRALAPLPAPAAVQEVPGGGLERERLLIRPAQFFAEHRVHDAPRPSRHRHRPARAPRAPG